MYQKGLREFHSTLLIHEVHDPVYKNAESYLFKLSSCEY